MDDWKEERERRRREGGRKKEDKKDGRKEGWMIGRKRGKQGSSFLFCGPCVLAS